VWGAIEENAILETIELSILEAFANTSASVKHVLRLDIIGTSRDVREARTRFIKDPILLDDRVGKGVAKVMLLFGFSSASQGGMISDCVYHILQGWAVKIPQDDSDSIQQSFRAFYLEFTDIPIDPQAVSRLAGEHNLRDAFEKGVARAATALLKDATVLSRTKTKRHNPHVRRRIDGFVARHQGE
jgi:hypothetical protein